MVRSQPGAIPPLSQGHLSVSAHIWLSQLGEPWVEARVTAEHPAIHRAALQHRIIQPQMSVVPKFCNLALEFLLKKRKEKEMTSQNTFDHKVLVRRWLLSLTFVHEVNSGDC